MNLSNPTFMNFIFDGTNFRGYLSESELIAKGYANDWAAAQHRLYSLKRMNPIFLKKQI